MISQHKYPVRTSSSSSTGSNNNNNDDVASHSLGGVLSAFDRDVAAHNKGLFTLVTDGQLHLRQVCVYSSFGN